MSDEEIIAYATDFRAGILGKRPSDMTCAMVCWPLTTLLNMIGVKCRAATSDEVSSPYGSCNHIWIQLDDGRALDPTADQFVTISGERYPPVYLGPLIPSLHHI